MTLPGPGAKVNDPGMTLAPAQYAPRERPLFKQNYKLLHRPNSICTLLWAVRLFPNGLSPLPLNVTKNTIGRQERPLVPGQNSRNADKQASCQASLSIQKQIQSQ